MLIDRKCMLLAGCCLATVTNAAWAQDSVPAEEAADDNVIVVTAQNRAQDVTDVPIAIDVVSGAELAAAGFNDANDLGKVAPVVQINQDQGTVKITVRGIGTNSNDEAQDTSVVANVDGEYINRPNALSVALFDLDRVEVLRGPQGTLYGRNSTGGAINFITRKPGNDFGANASFSYGNYNSIRADAGIDIPLGEIAAVRVAGFYDEHDGYVKHPAGGGFFVFPAFAAGRSDDNRSYGVRGTIKLNPSDALTVIAQGEYAERHFLPQIFAGADLNAAGNGPTGPGCNAPGYVRVGTTFPETKTVNNVPTTFARTLCIPQNTNFLSRIDRSQYPAPNFGLGGGIDQSTWAVRGRISYEFSDAATLTYIGGYRELSQGDVNGSNYLTLPTVYRSYNYVNEVETQSHELRLNGVIGGVTYQVGGFYFKENVLLESGFALPSFIFGLPPFTNTGAVTPPTILSYFVRTVSSDSKSVFGQIEVPLGDTLTAIGGLRYTSNKRSAVYINAGPFGNGPPDDIAAAIRSAPNAPATTDYLRGSGVGRKIVANLPYASTLNLGSKEDKVTWLIGLNWEPDPDTLVYGKVSTGFKAGGFDSVGTYRPESNTAYEIGLKKKLGDRGQHLITGSAFYYDYKDLQVSVLLNTAIGGQIFNAGKATIWGIELGGSFELSDNDHFDVSFNYLNAKYDELLASFNVFCINDTPPTGCDIISVGDIDPVTPGVQQPSFAGNRPPFSPEFIVTMGYEHVFDLNSAGTLRFRADTTFKSSYFTDFYNRADGQQKAFTQTNLLLEWRSVDKRFTVAGFARNLEDIRPLTYGGYTAAGPDDIFNFQFGQPRTYGIRVGVDF